MMLPGGFLSGCVAVTAICTMLTNAEQPYRASTASARLHVRGISHFNKTIASSKMVGNDGIATSLELTTYPKERACLDSEVTFRARLQWTSALNSTNRSFKYYWIDSVNPYDLVILTCDDYCEYKRVYSSSEEIKPGDYFMAVKVYEVHSVGRLRLVAKGEVHFMLTEYLNGEVICQQDLPVQHDKSVFSSEKPINLTAVLYDKFKDPVYHFLWKVDGEIVGSTVQPYYFVIFEHQQTSFHSIHVEVKAFIIGGNENENSKQLITKDGNFEVYINTKAPLHYLRFSSEHMYKVGSILTANFTCNGGLPVSLSWNITCQSNKLSQVAFGHTVFMQSCVFPFNYKLDQLGIYHIEAVVQNDVSVLTNEFQVETKPIDEDPDQLHILLPVILTVLILTIVFILLACFLPSKRRGCVEVANFDFHSRYADCSPQLMKIKRIASSLFRRNNYEKHKESNFRASVDHTAKYGSVQYL